ncbi:GAF domain-containing protein [Gluconobacter japonicus]|uniref:GAF domain-containing protein n=1 Tax=Gluconobacter japonicus TaxID=376620 RepID=UPI000784DF19|nr:GAF domain-containing protein [Gluconobacter japonicus]
MMATDFAPNFNKRPDPSSALCSLAAITAHELSPVSVLKSLEDGLATTFGYILLTVLVYDAEMRTLRRIFSTRPDINPVGGTKPVTESDWMKRVLGRGIPYIGYSREDLESVFFDHEVLWSIGCESVLNMPIVDAGKVLGSINMLHGPGWYSPEDIPTARVFAQLMVPLLLRS